MLGGKKRNYSAKSSAKLTAGRLERHKMKGFFIASRGLRNRCSTTELHQHEIIEAVLSLNYSFILNILKYRQKVTAEQQDFIAQALDN